MGHAQWLNDLFDPELLHFLSEEISCTINDDREHIKINAIVVTGISGSVIGGIISYITKIPLIIVRKSQDGSHSGYSIEYSNDIDGSCLNYIFLDDLISTGYTLRRVNDKMKREFNHSKLVKIYLYHEYEKMHDKTNTNIPLWCHKF